MKDIKNIASEQEEAFRAKADHDIVCFVEHCPLREQCLRWLVGRYADPSLYAVMSINPFYQGVGTQQCSKFRDSQRVMLKYGFTHLYEDMPSRIEKPIRQRLYVCFGRKRYFEMRKGERPVTPDQQKQIIDVCRQCGWQGPIVYDGEQEGWAW